MLEITRRAYKFKVAPAPAPASVLEADNCLSILPKLPTVHVKS